MSANPDQQRAKIQAWLEAFHRGSATLDAALWCGEFMTDDIELQYANNPVLKGADVRDMFSQYLPLLDLMEHEILYFDLVAPRIYQAARIRYRVKGDDAAQDIIIPGFATLFMRETADGSLKTYRAEIYLDPSPIYARMAQKSAGQV
ncbi:hypothetical protein A1O1_00033 [Capronia coronata CBS 617.96]|uniref:SnoaL-like domain-containing protein n=1 Tax=Capronia coronata CBS 617.96 TaxID=1182541 RepID=W9YZ20_9EURO|nr:uncharacterized protein A1O1_00033 [Capronia coronata CBS 617.96]EXJ94915.1 hypothetical protein A1O1_00033 [Capronia coronata CBS 617.96]